MFPVRTSCNVNAVAKVAVVVGLVLTGALSLAQPGARVGNSLLLLIDTSGSMGDQVGDGNPQAKIEVAKQAGIASLGPRRAPAQWRSPCWRQWDCANPVPRYQDFTRDVDRLTAFIGSLQPGGGTPMADALLFANRFMDRNGHAGARNRMIMLLADGKNDCGDASQAMETLQASGIIFATRRWVSASRRPRRLPPICARSRRRPRHLSTRSGCHAARGRVHGVPEHVQRHRSLGQFGNAPRLPTPSGQPDTDGQAPSDGDVLTGLLGSFVAPKDDAPPPWPAPSGDTGDEDHYLAVATSPPAGWRIEPGEHGYFGIGWHTESHHDAGVTAVNECRRKGVGSACSFNASGTSLRGGCVGLAVARSRDRDEDPERTYVVTSSSFRHLIARELRSGCQSTAFGGKYENTVIEHSCEIVQIMCAGDLVPTPATPAH